MPELLEIEYYRRAAESALNREIADVATPDDKYLKRVGAKEMRQALIGHQFEGTHRRGKLLMMDVSSGPVLGLRFGMTGRLIVDGAAPIEKLEYGSGKSNPDWDRFEVRFVDGGAMTVSDPRRLGNVTLDPDLTRMGPDAWKISLPDLTTMLGKSSAPLKSRLMDQARIAGLGNLLTDETLWRSGLDPRQPAKSVGVDDVKTLHLTIRAVLDELSERGGSHTGDLQEERSPQGRCPRDGAELNRDKVGGRTTYWCPEHQV